MSLWPSSRLTATVDPVYLREHRHSKGGRDRVCGAAVEVAMVSVRSTMGRKKGEGAGGRRGEEWELMKRDQLRVSPKWPANTYHISRDIYCNRPYIYVPLDGCRNWQCTAVPAAAAAALSP